jgi:hypothetical protein
MQKLLIHHNTFNVVTVKVTLGWILSTERLVIGLIAFAWVALHAYALHCLTVTVLLKVNVRYSQPQTHS